MLNKDRILSIDIFRAITMLLMIFVNDLWTLNGIPVWMEHSKADQDFLGFADIVFPCFLFVMGMAIPFAINNRASKGDKGFRMLYHIFFRSIALLAMGFFLVNIDSLNETATGISNNWFQILVVTGFFLIWNVYPALTDWKKYIFMGLQLTGIVLLWLLFIKFRGGNDGNELMKPQWWGILGLIGWAYLFSSVIFLFARKYIIALPFFWLLFSILNIAEHSHWLSFPIPGGSLLGFPFAGITASILLDRANSPGKKRKLPFLYLGIALGLIVLGLILRNFFIISKIQATPTWIFLCNGIAFALLSLIYYLVDLKGKSKWFSIIKPAGTSTLTCYLIPYFYYSLAVYAFTLPVFLKTGIIGIMKSLLFALLIIGITAVLGKLKIKLKI